MRLRNIPIVPCGLPHVRDELSDGVVVVVDDVDVLALAVPPVGRPLLLQHEVKVQRATLPVILDLVVLLINPKGENNALKK